MENDPLAEKEFEEENWWDPEGLIYSEERDELLDHKQDNRLEEYEDSTAVNHNFLENTKEEDYALAQKSLAGDKGAADALFNATYPKVLNYVKSMSLECFEAEDITQDVMTISLKKLKSFNGTSLFSTYAIGIASNCVNNHLRKKSREMKKLGIRALENVNEEDYDGESLIERTADSEYTKSNPVYFFERKENIERASNYLLPSLEKLTEKQRAVLIYRAIHNYSFKEIARIMDSNDDAIEQVYRAAKKALPKKADKLLLGSADYGKSLYENNI